MAHAWDKITYVGPTYDPVLHWTSMTASSEVNRTRSNSYKRTRCLSRADKAPVPYIQPTKINSSRVINVAAHSESKTAHEWGKITYGPTILHRTPITALSKVNLTHGGGHKHTSYSSSASTASVPYIQPTKINVRPRYKRWDVLKKKHGAWMR